MNPLLTTDQFMEALALYREFRGESDAAKAAGLAVIRNRASDEKRRWPRTTSEVVTQSGVTRGGIRVWQFSSFDPKDPNCTVFPAPSNAGQWQAWNDCCKVVLAPLADPTDGSTLYEALPDGVPKPNWADPAKLTVTIGKTRFYK